MYAVMVMYGSKMDSRGLVIKNCTGVVKWFRLFFPLQPCTILNQKHFVGMGQYVKYVKC